MGYKVFVSHFFIGNQATLVSFAYQIYMGKK